MSATEAPLPAAARGAKDQSGAREALRAGVGLLLLLAIGKSVAGLVPFGSDVVFTAAAAFQLYVPLWLIQRHGELPESHFIHVHGLLLGGVAAVRRRMLAARRRRGRKKRSGLDEWLAHYGRGAVFRPKDLAKDLARALLVAIVTFAPFAVGHHFWQVMMAGEGANVVFRPTLPPELAALLLKNVFLVALPEELFYRGFLETRLERVWPTRRSILGIPLGRAVLLASAMFALGHWLGEWGNPARLAPFFPAFVFSMLTRRGGSITGAVVYHGLSNAFSATLLAGYRIM